LLANGDGIAGRTVEILRPMFRRDSRYFIAFNVLAIDGEDLRARPLLERKRRLRAIMPRIDSRLLYHDHVDGCGRALFDAVHAHDLEGFVAKWKHSRYHTDGQTTSWLKIKNPEYSQMEGRHEAFVLRRSVWT
jgi:ATP-dependent DNA ligase